MIGPRSQGTTPSERILAKICQQTFLKLWSYPNVFRDQGQTAQCESGKEICDLLVVFGDTVIIFSDKSCEMKDTDDLGLDWSRWFNKTIYKSAKQIYGAERWIRNYPHRVFIDPDCKQPLPISISDINSCRFHRVVVAIGARERCKLELGGSGSPQIRPALTGRDHIAQKDITGGVEITERFRPFSVGQVDPGKGFIHVEDEYTLSTLMQELDTVYDLENYLTEKENLILSGKLDFADGEEELLYEYLRNVDDQGNHGFRTAERQRFSVAAGNWERWKSGAVYRAEQEADRPSREFWDQTIDTFTDAAFGDNLLPGSTSHMSEVEACLRVMASESRLSRRALTRAFLERMAQSEESLRVWRMLFSLSNPETGYIFLFQQRMSHPTPEEWAQELNIRLRGLSMVYAWKNRHLERIIGIGTESGLDGPHSFHLILCIPGSFDAEGYADLQRLLNVKDEDINAKIGFEHELLPK